MGNYGDTSKAKVSSGPLAGWHRVVVSVKCTDDPAKEKGVSGSPVDSKQSAYPTTITTTACLMHWFKNLYHFARLFNLTRNSIY